MNSKRCPRCGMLSPPEAVRCDCGYNFETGRTSAPLAGGKQKVKVGVGGWLAFLVVGLAFLWPLLRASRMSSEFQAAERATPDLLQNAAWLNFKTASWALFSLCGIVSVAAGIALSSSFRPRSVSFAVAVLWIVGPIQQLASIALLAIEFGTEAVMATLPELLGATTLTALGSGIWTAYLMKSKRVRLTYYGQVPGAPT